MNQNNSSRVYINPNFKRVGHTIQNPSMYVNPKFSLPLANTQVTNIANTSKIYVNPNFIPGNTFDNTAHSESKHQECSSSESCATKYNYIESMAGNTKSTALQSFHMAKSRYTFVRQTNENQMPQVQPIQITKTIKINKYKSVAMHDVKKNLETQSSNFQPDSANYVRPQPLQTKNLTSYYESRYKIVQHAKERKSTTTVTKYSTYRNFSLNSPKALMRSNNVKKHDKKTFKINNIPCPLYKKFGKCLRNIRGKCEYKHDKKHVSICRKFLKGLCYESDCLLSHEITAEKMPTCSFYLRGMCTKEGCPYLHVKLNEKTRICTDFLKGYCEKGDQCLNRHINACASTINKSSCSSKPSPYPQQNGRYLRTKKNIKKTKILNQNIRPNSISLNKSKKEQIIADQRYYKDTAETEDKGNANEIIKPTRCKLGTLPSFIRL